ncbi:diacylglycerol kinase family lipid kinase [Planctomycetota bacterium]|nr:diacylglycerol kinase family lipid kinase [Planctomycetota bacterium]
MSRRLLAIINPISGKGKAGNTRAQFEKLAQITHAEIVVKETTRAGDAREFADKASSERFDGVFAVGGDGTINEVVNGLGPNGLPLAVIPRGTGNVLAKELKAPKNPLGYATAVRNWSVKQRDLGRTDTGRLFTCFIGAGFDGQCTKAFEERKGSIRMMQYVPIMWRAIGKSFFSSIQIDDEPNDGPVGYALIAISPCYGGPLQIVKHANPTDAQFDVLTINRKLSFFGMMRLISRAFFRTMHRSKSVTIRQTASAKISADEKVPIQIDGDFAGYVPISCEIISNGFRYLSAR